jgi:hypothetical protein
VETHLLTVYLRIFQGLYIILMISSGLGVDGLLMVILRVLLSGFLKIEAHGRLLIIDMRDHKLALSVAVEVVSRDLVLESDFMLLRSLFYFAALAVTTQTPHAFGVFSTVAHLHHHF